MTGSYYKENGLQKLVLNESFRRISAILSVLLACLTLSSCSISSQNRDQDVEIEGGRRSYTNPDAPKVIESKEIISFEYGFDSEDLVYLDNVFPYDYCYFSLENQDDGVLYKATLSRDFQGLTEVELVVSHSTLEDLQNLLEEEDVARYNGIDEFVNGLPNNFGGDLLVKYASGEYISASDNSQQLLGSQTNQAIYGFFRKLAKEGGQDFLDSAVEVEGFQELLTGLWVEFDDKDDQEIKHLEFKDDTIKIYIGKELVVETTYFLEFNRIYNAAGNTGSFGIFETIEWDDGYLIGLDDEGQETRFIIPNYDKIEDF